jgi:hypothetical protein
MPYIDGKSPKKVRSVKPVWTSDGYVLFWTAPKGKGWKDEAVLYGVYRFDRGERVNIEDASHLVALTPETFYELPRGERVPCVYVVTALDRLQNESKGVKVKVKE